MINTDRLAVIATLSIRFPGFGRTALMKYCYFLQVLKGVPLGYRFSLYSYGPFDSDVLADLDTAESINGVSSSVVYFPGGYGYKIEPGIHANRLIEIGREFLLAYEADFKWLQKKFSGKSPGELELASTLVYSDREAEDKGEMLTVDKLAKRVNDLKPRYQLSTIEEVAKSLWEQDLLNSISEEKRHAF